MTLSFIFENIEELGVDTSGYSHWGAGARIAAEPDSYGGDNIPTSSMVIMQYIS